MTITRHSGQRKDSINRYGSTYCSTLPISLHNQTFQSTKLRCTRYQISRLHVVSSWIYTLSIYRTGWQPRINYSTEERKRASCSCVSFGNAGTKQIRSQIRSADISADTQESYMDLGSDLSLGPMTPSIIELKNSPAT